MGLLRIFKAAIERTAPESLADQYYAQSCRFYQSAHAELGPAAQPIELCHRAYDLFIKENFPKSLFAIRPPRPFHPSIATFACLSHPECGEAISLFLFHKEFPTMAQRHVKYESRLSVLIGNIVVAYQARDWAALNRLFQDANPDYHVKAPFPVVDPKYEDIFKDAGR